MKNLVIVESPSKCRPIEKYLGSSYTVLSSKGHIRDLATTGKYGLGVDIENDFKPNYVAIKGKNKIISDLKKAVKSSDFVYLATDPDREGEAISWHLKDTLDIPDNKYKRITFNEITKNVVNNAINEARDIDYSLVKSQETRRILDRIIGFRLSKLMQVKTGGKSAGRVQSVALKLIVDREREIEAFIPEEYYTITANFSDFSADLFKYHGNKIEVKTESEANDIIDSLKKAFTIESVETKDKKIASKPVFKTSTLQRDASSKYNFSASKTMQIAQKLYEGIDLGDDVVGLITYMRTDSERLSAEFIDATFQFIKDKYGEAYVGYVKKPKKTENVQDAHEGIRPTSILRTPESVKMYLSNDEYKLYSLIYNRALASLMADQVLASTTVLLENNGYLFKATGSTPKFSGYKEVYSDYEEETDKSLPDFSKYKSDVLVSESIEKEQHFTKPEPRYTEASLIKEMESLGIGRPSTYATIVRTIVDRGYVTIMEKKFYPTEIGILTTDKLQEFFSNIINVEYTANMETDLDLIAVDKCDNIELLKKFYNDFSSCVDTAYQEMEKKEPEKTGEVCPECGSDLVIRKSKYGEFIACSNYPTCKYIKPEETKVEEIMDCPKCDGKIVAKKTRRGKVFYGCTNYPKCDFASWDEPTSEVCPECGTNLVIKKGEKVCPNCKKEK
ncbi:MAG: type I DNA topoisomerase [Bacilli bacterium]|nr:type I DNA topoisomerase [Bacilli bacterium]